MASPKIAISKTHGNLYTLSRVGSSIFIFLDDQRPALHPEGRNFKQLGVWGAKWLSGECDIVPRASNAQKKQPTVYHLRYFIIL